MKIRILVLMGLLCLSGHAFAQQGVAVSKVVGTCGGQSLNPGAPYPVTVDTSGRPCPPAMGAPTSPALTPIAPPGGNLTLTTGGISQQLLSTAGCPNFITVSNGQTAADQGGIAAAETAYYNPTGNAASATPGGQSVPIYAGVARSIVAQAGKAITWVAATTGHKLTAVCE